MAQCCRGAAPAKTLRAAPAVAAAPLSAPGSGVATAAPGLSPLDAKVGAASATDSRPVVLGPDAVLGAMVKIRTSSGRVLQGELFAVSHGMAVIREVRKHTYLRADVHTVNLAAVTHVAVLGRADGALPASAPLPRLDPAAATARVRDTGYLLRSELSRVGDGVSGDGQAVFDLLHKVFGQVEWSGTDIVIQATIKVPAPYKPDVVRVVEGVPAADQRLDFVRKQLERFWSGRATA